MSTPYYISEKKGKFFKQLKENFKEEECLIFLDFAENYSFMIQYEVKLHHWSCQQATLHNVVVNYFAGIVLFLTKVLVSSAIFYSCCTVCACLHSGFSS